MSKKALMHMQPVHAVWSGPSLFTDTFYIVHYSKCPKISYNKISNKMAYSADPDQNSAEPDQGL